MSPFRMLFPVAFLLVLAASCDPLSGEDDDDMANDDDASGDGPCDPSGLWQVHINPTVTAPDGCGQGGIVAQSEADHIVEVSSDGAGGWDAILLAPDTAGLDSSILTTTFSGVDGGCALQMNLLNIVTMPGPGGIATISLEYDHSVTEDSEGQLEGSGSVHFYSTASDPAGEVTVIEDCVETFVLSGSFTPAG